MKRFFVFITALSLIACTPHPKTPVQAPPAIEVAVPVPVACEVAQIAPTRLPGAVAAIPVDIFDAVKLVLADRAVLKADRTRMAAANSDPCPAKR